MTINLLRISALSAAVLASSVLPVRGGDFVFEVPQLLGSYLGDDSLALPPVDVSLDLGMTFAEIDSASLRLAGNQVTGLYGDLNFEGEFPLTADLLAWFSDAQSDSALSESVLPAVDGSFDVNQMFRVPGASPEVDYSNWQAGVADFTFVATTPPMIATTFLIEMPGVDITTAELIISGQPNLDGFMLGGDFNADGDVDSVDGLMWQAALGATADADADLTGMTEGGDFLIWQRNVLPTSAEVVPEPGGLALLLLTVLFRRRKHD